MKCATYWCVLLYLSLLVTVSPEISDELLNEVNVCGADSIADIFLRWLCFHCVYTACIDNEGKICKSVFSWQSVAFRLSLFMSSHWFEVILMWNGVISTNSGDLQVSSSPVKLYNDSESNLRVSSWSVLFIIQPFLKTLANCSAFMKNFLELTCVNFLLS